MKTSTIPWCAVGVLLCAACGAGRTPLLPPVCELRLDPSTLDFGEVAPGQVASRQVRVSNVGGATCHLEDIVLASGSDGGFKFASETQASLAVQPGASVDLSVIFQPTKANLPLERQGTLTADVDAPGNGVAQVPLKARIQSKCVLAVTPLALDFGQVRIDDTAIETVALTNRGEGDCQLDQVGLSARTDSQFFLPDVWTGPKVLAPGEERILRVGFAAKEVAKPRRREGDLAFTSSDPKLMNGMVPLTADIDVGCDLTWTPARLDFGNVVLNTKVSADLTLQNEGTETCAVSRLGLSAESNSGFALSAAQATSFSVAPDGKMVVSVFFTASDISEPHLKTGTLVFDTGEVRDPAGEVALSAYVSTVCVEASRWVYTVDNRGGFARFDPKTLKFTDIARLDCPSTSSPFSMAVDQNAVAWVLYGDGNLFKVDTSTGKCGGSGFKTGQQGYVNFGMGFVFDPATGTDTLYIAGGRNIGMGESGLAIIEFPSLQVVPIGKVEAGDAELTGTGDGELWGFVPEMSSTTKQAVLVRLDPNSGVTLESHTYPKVSGGSAWAVKFWGGSFWIFLNTSVFEVPRDTPDVIRTAIADTRRAPIVGAGVSTCAPLH